jgi:ribosome assembly protein RRB1
MTTVRLNFPSQLLLVHQGQEELKELRYHPTLGFIVSTGTDELDVFRPAIERPRKENMR